MDNETSGTGNSYDYGFRIYNPRIGKFLSVDPLTHSYPMLTPYQFASNSPIMFIDMDGLEAILPPQIYEFGYYMEQKVMDAMGVIAEASETTWEITKGVSVGAYNVLKSMTPAGVAQYAVQTKTDRENAWNQDWSDRFNPLKTYDAIKNVYINGSIKEKAQLTTELVGAGVVIFEGVRQVTGVTTPYSHTVQSVGKASIEARQAVKSGSTLYRLGTEGVSKTGAEAQFWVLENPLEYKNPADFAKKYNIPVENIKNADFIETAVLKDGSNFITRPAGKAPGMDPNGGGGIEAVIDVGGTTNNVKTPIKK